MYLFPLWSSPLHRNQTRFVNSQQSNFVPKCASNAIVESHFAVVKGKTFQYKRVRPLDFVLKQLTLNRGKLKELSLPGGKKAVRKRRATCMDPQEYWGRRKKTNSGKYSDSVTSRRILFGDAAIEKSSPNHVQDTLVPSRPVALPYDELSDVDIGMAMDKLHKQFHKNTGGLQYPGLGQFLACKSAPRFRMSPLPFVQIINVGDHWICVSNVFGQTLRDVYIYDSIYSCVDKTRVVQVILSC